MELSWLTRIKITVVLAVGIVVWGVFMWHFAAPQDPMSAVMIVGSRMSFWGMFITAIAAFAAGFAGYFIGWPYGRHIGILAAPAGLAAWAVRGQDMASIMRANSDISVRHDFYISLGLEGIVWFAIAVIGFAGVITASRIVPSPGVSEEIDPPSTRPKTFLNGIIAFFLSALIAAVCVSFFAKDVILADKVLGSVIGQPGKGQAAFAAMVSFGIAAFSLKLFWDADYIWSAMATVLVCFAAMNFAARNEILVYISGNWPASFFAKPVYALLPIQIVSFGILGSIAGYWLAVRFRYWQAHHSK